MAAFPIPTIDGVASVLSLVLATLASLRAASRLEQRLRNQGSIGLMGGPPILGPAPVNQRQQTQQQKQRQQHNGVVISGTHDDPTSVLDDGIGRITEVVEADDAKDGEDILPASPLWEHTEAFRRAVILGLISDDNDAFFDHVSNSILFDVARTGGKRADVRGGNDEDVAVAAAVEAGLFVRSRATHRGGSVRGGGTRVGMTPLQSTKISVADGSSNRSNPLNMMTSWFLREISAPLAAIPAWHGLLCTYLREQKETKVREYEWCLLTPLERIAYFLTGRSGRKTYYDPTGLDFDSSISATAHIPLDTANDNSISVDLSLTTTTKAVRVKSFAPNTFRDLRNKCFRMTERDYAQSVLNAMDGTAHANDIRDSSGGEATIPITNTDLQCDLDSNNICDVLNAISCGGHQSKNSHMIRKEGSPTTLPYISFQSNSKGAARAGTFFFFTADGAFMIKTVKKEEAKAFLEMLPEYHRFMSERVNARNSLLTRIFGMYSIRPVEADAQTSADATGDRRWEGGLFSSSCQDNESDFADDERIYLVMHSVFPSEASEFITERFDLKGSTVGRACSLEERKAKGANAVLKDLDLKREVTEELNKVGGEGASNGQYRKKNSHYGICVGRQLKTTLMAQLERDVDLLHRCNVLDYSLLVGVADMEDKTNKSKMSGTRAMPKFLQNFLLWLDFPMPYYGAGMTKVNGGALSALHGSRKGKQVMYYMGIIDFLQPWTLKKRLERDLKGMAGFDVSAISCVAPADYAGRFLKFVDGHVT